jgi:secondary thiamine-phosphate synthase enzyme
MWLQRSLTLKARPRGFHLVTDEVVAAVPQLTKIRIGMAHVFITHTSASLAINENASPDVRSDLETHFNRSVPENAPYVHDDEGADDMPAHIKAVLIGASLSIPITEGALALGTWQGIYLCEHRDRGGARTVVVTVHGEE